MNLQKDKEQSQRCRMEWCEHLTQALKCSGICPQPGNHPGSFRVGVESRFFCSTAPRSLGWLFVGQGSELALKDSGECIAPASHQGQVDHCPLHFLETTHAWETPETAPLACFPKSMSTHLIKSNHDCKVLPRLAKGCATVDRQVERAGSRQSLCLERLLPSSCHL